MDMVKCFSLMEIVTRECGREVSSMAEESILGRVESFLKDSFGLTSGKEKEYYTILMDLGLKDTGGMIFEMKIIVSLKNESFLITFNGFYYLLLEYLVCLLYTSPSPRDLSTSRMPSSA